MSEPARPSARRILIAGLLAAALVLPFYDRPVHQDDWAYLRVAELALERGFGVFDSTTIYQGLEVSARDSMPHGPVWILLQMLALQFGEHAISVGHLIVAALFGLLSGSLAWIARSIGAPPVRTALTFAVAPAPWVLSTSLMTDVPMLALFTTSVALALHGLQRERLWALLLSGVLGAAAALTRYHGFAIVPLLAVLPPLVGAPWRRGLVAPLTAFGAFFGVLAGMLTATGTWDALRATSELAEAEIDRRACFVATVAALGGVSLGWVLAFVSAPRASLTSLQQHRSAWIATVLGAAGGLATGVYGTQLPASAPSGINVLLYWVCFTSGGAIVGALLWTWGGLRWAFTGGDRWRAWRDEHGVLAWLALWSLGFAFAAWMTVPFGSTRYVLPAFPGVFLLAALAARRLLPGYASWVALAVSAVLGLTSTIADRNAARINPRLAAQVAAQVAPGGPWSEGQTWIWGDLGFRWYLEELAGLPVLATRSKAPAPGDRILKSMILSTASPDDGKSGRYRLHPEVVQKMRAGAIVDYEDPWPVRIHNSHAGAGFYGHDGGFLPFAWSSATHDRLQVWDVEGGNRLLEAIDLRRAETSQVAGEQPGDPPLQGEAAVERFSVFLPDAGAPQPPGIDVSDRVALRFKFAGRYTWPNVPVPSDGLLEVLVGEHGSMSAYSIPGPGSLFRVRVNGQVRAERRVDTRGGDATGWYLLRADLGAAGRGGEFEGQVDLLAREVAEVGA
ncbi:MAG: hypothetical protein AAFZ65_15705 [Planctomycetota bacterium]